MLLSVVAVTAHTHASKCLCVTETVPHTRAKKIGPYARQPERPDAEERERLLGLVSLWALY